MINIGIVGCGYVADFYLSTLKDYPEIKVCGLYDKINERMVHLAENYSHPCYQNLEELLSDQQTNIILNLTNPESHYEINRLILEAGKHAYSEKPLSLKFSEAQELYNLAKSKQLQIVSAPCSLLGEQAQTMWKALREQLIGKVWLVYAEMDDGPVHLMNPETWRSSSGVPWPVNDEFEIGCTMEHAGYFLPWLVAWFGPALEVTAFSSCRIHDKKTAVPLEINDTPDFSVATIKFASGVVARLTCGIVAEHDHALKIYGEKGILALDECWNYGSPIRVHRYNKRGFVGVKYPFVRKNSLLSYIYGLRWKKLPFVRKPDHRTRWQGKRPAIYFMDFARGVRELGRAINEDRTCRISSELSLHVNELTLAIQNAGENSSTYTLKTSCGEVEPMPWAD